MNEHDCCFRNYCRNLKLGGYSQLPNPNDVSLKILDDVCYFKEIFVDVTPLIWCYRLDTTVQQKPQSVKQSGFPIFGFKIKDDGILGGLPLASQFAYGSLFKNNLKEKRNPKDPLDSGLIYVDCKQLYVDLSEKSQFLAFIRDSLNTTWLVMTLVDEIEKKLDSNQSFVYKILGCSFYL
jgi:hypothetical protein